MNNSAAFEPFPQKPSPMQSRSVSTVTITLIAANVLVYLAMGASGVSLASPTPLDVARWGGDFGPLTVGEHQWWRLLTSCFLHFGLIHIALNMYVLYQIGPFIETVFGRLRYLVIYFASGIAGSLLSVYVHPMAVGAGASGAIFGLYGAVFGFLLIRRHSLNPVAVSSIGKSAGIFVLYNVVFGSMQGTTDLSAHFGGLIAGFAAGMLLAQPRSGTMTQPNF